MKGREMGKRRGRRRGKKEGKLKEEGRETAKKNTKLRKGKKLRESYMGKGTCQIESIGPSPLHLSQPQAWSGL